MYRNDPTSVNGPHVCIKEGALTVKRSSSSLLLSVPAIKSRATLGDRAFIFAAPKLWNSLPSELREIKSIATFKRHLKTYLFKLAYI